MRAFEALAEDLAHAWSSDRDLSAVLALPSFARFLAAIHEANHTQPIEISDLNPSKFGAMTLLSDQVKVLASYQGWIASTVQRTEPSRLINAAPFPTILIPLGNEIVEISTFHIDPKSFETASLSAHDKVTPIATRAHNRGTPFCNSDRENAYLVQIGMRPANFLRITGPAQAPFIHFFDKDSRSYRHTAMATQDHTSRYFYAEAVKNILYDINLDRLRPEEKHALINYIRRRIIAETDMPNECWSLLQALFVLDKDVAINKLTRLAALEGPLQTISTQVLDEISEPIQYG